MEFSLVYLQRVLHGLDELEVVLLRAEKVGHFQEPIHNFDVRPKYCLGFRV